MGCFIYLLHFDTKLSHAGHYVGSTTNLKERLLVHASGKGSRLTRAVAAKKINWRLGSLWCGSYVGVRRVERYLKDMRNSPKFCSICLNLQSESPFLSRSVVGLDVSTILYPTSSKGLREWALKSDWSLSTVEFDFACFEDCSAMKVIEKQSVDSLGFIPMGGKEGLTTLIKNQRVLVARVGGVCVGYLCYTQNLREKRIRIQQTAVHDFFKFRGIGKSLVNRVIDLYDSDWFASCSVREDLQAVNFWESIGFAEVSRSPHKTSGNILIHFEKRS